MPTNRRRVPRAFAACALAAVLAAPGCNTAEGPALPGSGDFGGGGSGDGGGGGGDMAQPRDGGGGGGGGDMACVGIPAGECTACLQANCNAEMSACFTGTWPSTGSTSGTCAGLFACECDCVAKGGKSCRITCAQKIGQGCFECIVKVGTCATAQCAMKCPQ